MVQKHGKSTRDREMKIHQRQSEVYSIKEEVSRDFDELDRRYRIFQPVSAVTFSGVEVVYLLYFR